MIRRKDSMSFAEFMRGKYDVDDKDYIGKLIGNMTIAEQATIANLPFDMTWRIAWETIILEMIMLNHRSNMIS
jgi:hypothetical protein